MGASIAVLVRRPNSGDRHERAHSLVERAEAYIERNLGDESLSLGCIAAQLAVTPSHFSSVFKRTSGMSVMEYLTSRRMERAGSLLASAPSAKIMDIAEMVGYADPYYFSKCFHKYFGAPPSRFCHGNEVA